LGRGRDVLYALLDALDFGFQRGELGRNLLLELGEFRGDGGDILLELRDLGGERGNLGGNLLLELRELRGE
jgi:hypothetical protein